MKPTLLPATALALLLEALPSLPYRLPCGYSKLPQHAIEAYAVQSDTKGGTAILAMGLDKFFRTK